MDEVTEFLRESNAIEGVYDEQSLADAQVAWEYLVVQPELSHDIICQTHRLLMTNQSLRPEAHGVYRNRLHVDVEVGGRICPPYQAVRRRITYWLKTYQRLDPQDAHVRFELLHPFEDGNGRIGRMLLNWHRLRLGQPIMVIREAQRQEYYRWFGPTLLERTLMADLLDEMARAKRPREHS